MGLWIYLTYGYIGLWLYVWCFRLLLISSLALLLYYLTLMKIKCIWKMRSQDLYKLICGLALVLYRFWSWPSRYSPTCVSTTRSSNGLASTSWSVMRPEKLSKASSSPVRLRDSIGSTSSTRRRLASSSSWWVPSCSSSLDIRLITPWTSRSSMILIKNHLIRHLL